jgi:Ni,Fe-hydrogenase maturation factor
MKILVFGNPFIEADSLPLRILPKLRAAFPEIEFKEFDPSEELHEEGRDLIILDAVQGIEKVILISDTRQLNTDTPRYSLHDFDLGISLKLLKKMDLIDSVKIIGVPMNISEEVAFKEVSVAIKSNLF